MRGKFIKEKYMTVVNSKEFVSNQDKYFDIAMNEQLFIQRGDYTFIIARTNDKKREHEKTDDVTFSGINKLSDKFRGVFSKEVGNDFMRHTRIMREEWDSI